MKILRLLRWGCLLLYQNMSVEVILVFLTCLSHTKYLDESLIYSDLRYKMEYENNKYELTVLPRQTWAQMVVYD